MRILQYYHGSRRRPRVARASEQRLCPRPPAYTVSASADYRLGSLAATGRQRDAGADDVPEKSPTNRPISVISPLECRPKTMPQISIDTCRDMPLFRCRAIDARPRRASPASASKSQYYYSATAPLLGIPRCHGYFAALASTGRPNVGHFTALFRAINEERWRLCRLWLLDCLSCDDSFCRFGAAGLEGQLAPTPWP